MFRRGPSGQVATFSWDTRTDTFELGQWLKGRIYPKRSDLSPDGRYLIYFAADFRDRREAGSSWTAVSRAPYLKALDLYPKGDAWQGGGLFVDNEAYWLNDSYLNQKNVSARNSELVLNMDKGPRSHFGYEDTGVYYPRLLRDGWKWKRLDGTLENPTHVFAKAFPHGWVLEKRSHHGFDEADRKGVYWEEHALREPGSGDSLHMPDWEWADIDRKSLVWAEHGRLYRVPLDRDSGMGEPKLLRDFSGDTFVAVEAPYS